VFSVGTETGKLIRMPSEVMHYRCSHISTIIISFSLLIRFCDCGLTPPSEYHLTLKCKSHLSAICFTSPSVCTTPRDRQTSKVIHFVRPSFYYSAMSILGEILLLATDITSEITWSFRNSEGCWSQRSKLKVEKDLSLRWGNGYCESWPSRQATHYC
jgi:hypothetical protein